MITAEDIFDQEGITATESINTLKGRTEQITVNIPAVAVEAGAKATYESKDPEVAEVDENGDISDMEDLGDSDYMDNNEEE